MKKQSLSAVALVLTLAMTISACRTGGRTKTRPAVEAVESPAGEVAPGTMPEEFSEQPEVKVAENQANPSLIPDEKLDEETKPSTNGLRSKTNFESPEQLKSELEKFLTSRDGGFSMEKDSEETLSLIKRVMEFKNDKGELDSENAFHRLAGLNYFFTKDEKGPSLSLDESREMTLVISLNSTNLESRTFVAIYKAAFEERKIVQDALDEAKRGIKYDQLLFKENLVNKSPVTEASKAPVSEAPAAPASVTPAPIATEAPAAPASETPAPAPTEAPAAPASVTPAPAPTEAPLADSDKSE